MTEQPVQDFRKGTSKDPDYVNPIDKRRPIRIPTRISSEEYDALFSMHIETRRSLSNLLLEALLDFLEKHGKIEPNRVEEILDAERSKRTYVRSNLI